VFVAKRKTKNVGGFILVVGLLIMLNTFPTLFSFGRLLLRLIKMRLILCIQYGSCSNLRCCRVPNAFITITVFRDKRILTLTLI